MAVFVLSEDALAFGALGNLPGTPAVDLTMAPTASIVAAPSVQGRHLRGLSAILIHSVCLARVTFLPTVLTKFMGTRCPEMRTDR